MHYKGLHTTNISSMVFSCTLNTYHNWLVKHVQLSNMGNQVWRLWVCKHTWINKLHVLNSFIFYLVFYLVFNNRPLFLMFANPQSAIGYFHGHVLTNLIYVWFGCSFIKRVNDVYWNIVYKNMSLNCLINIETESIM